MKKRHCHQSNKHSSKNTANNTNKSKANKQHNVSGHFEFRRARTKTLEFLLALFIVFVCIFASCVWFGVCLLFLGFVVVARFSLQEA